MKNSKKAIFKFKPFSKKQLKVLTWWLPDSPVSDADGVIADGAIRSGKTISMALSFVMWAMESFEHQNFAMCGKTVGSFRRNVWFWLKLMLISRGYKYKDHKTDNYIEIRKNDKSNFFYIFGGRDESSQDLIQGMTLSGIFFDEVALMPESFVNQGTGRCSVEGSKYFFNCNPDGPKHWFNVEWILKAREKNLIHLHFTMDDNLSLSEKIKERYKRMYVGVFYDRYIRGLWKLASGAIFDMWTDENEIAEGDLPLGLKTYARRYIAIDYGTSNATVFLDIYDDGDTAYVVREYYYDSRKEMRQKTDREYADDLVEFIKNDIYPTHIILDPSAASFKAELRTRGVRVKAADNEVLDGIRMTATLIAQRKLKIVRGNCDKTIGEILSYTWDEKALIRGIEKPMEVADHSVDCVRYLVKTIIKPRRLSR